MDGQRIGDVAPEHAVDDAAPGDEPPAPGVLEEAPGVEAAVLVADIRPNPEDDVVDSLRSAGHRALFEQVDTSSPADNERMVARAVSEFGRVDVLVAAAGMSHAQYVRGVNLLDLRGQAEERKIIKGLHPTFHNASALKLDPPPLYLNLWPTHPLLDEAAAISVDFLGSNGMDLPGTQDRSSGWAYWPSPQGGWMLITASPGSVRTIPKKLTIRFRYCLGQLQNTQDLEVSSDNHVSMTLEGGSMLGSVGQSLEGRAFVSLAVNNAKLGNRRFGVVAITKDGRDLGPLHDDNSHDADAFATLDAEKKAALEADMILLMERMNRGGDRSLVIPSEYLEAVITKR